MCYYFKPCIKIKDIDIASHRYRPLIRGYEGFIAQRPQIGGHRDFNLSIYYNRVCQGLWPSCFRGKLDSSHVEN